MSVLLVLALSCRRPVPVKTAFDASPAVVAAPRVVAGTTQDGRFQDSDAYFSIAVRGTWQARPGWADELRLVELDDPGSGAHVEIWRVKGEALPPRSGCTWTFSDRGPYLETAAPNSGQFGAVTIATCLPQPPESKRILAWVVGDNSALWRVELHLSEPGLMPATRATLKLLETVRFP